VLRMPALIGALVAFIGFAAEADAQYYNPPPYRPDYPRPFPGPFAPRGEFPPPVQICAAPRSPPGSPCACYGPRRRLLPGWVE
jgi:hypothetical protein